MCISTKDDELALSGNIGLAVERVDHVPSPWSPWTHIKLQVCMYRYVGSTREIICHAAAILLKTASGVVLHIHRGCKAPNKVHEALKIFSSSESGLQQLHALY